MKILEKFLITWLPLLFLALVLSGCQPKSPKVLNRAFYYWKTTFDMPAPELEKLRNSDIKKLYVRYFDVAWDQNRNEAQPVAPLLFKTPFPETVEIIPTVYLTNKTLSNLPEKLVPRLAAKILSKIYQVHKTGKGPQIREIQLDCDWTESTKLNYFRLVSDLKKRVQQQIQVSVTIRLHQLKYAARTGIPPADRGMLMFYNMGKISAENGTNSIYETGTAQKYLTNFKPYPLPLDVALPIFSWGILIRKGKPVSLINNLRATDLQVKTEYKALAANRFEVQKLQFQQKRYLYPGDIIKLETLTPADTKQAAQQVAPILKTDTLTTALFYWDKQNLENYPPNDLEEIYNSLL